jgi:hypothetical protein
MSQGLWARGDVVYHKCGNGEHRLIQGKTFLVPPGIWKCPECGSYFRVYMAVGAEAKALGLRGKPVKPEARKP